MSIGVYLVVMFTIVPWALKWIKGRFESKTVTYLAVAVVATISSIVTEMLGLHHLLGAVIAGAALPELYKQRIHWIEKPTLLYLVPFFVISAGLGIKLTALSTGVWVILGTLVVSNIVGQILGTLLVAKWFGSDWSVATATMAFMTCKGVVEMSVANALHSSGVIPVELYNSAILMAIFLTAITAPIAYLALRARWSEFVSQSPQPVVDADPVTA